MANKLYNLARMSSATVGTGTITLGSAVSGYLTFALAGVADADVVSYGIKDGANSEVGTGTYTSAGTTLSRTVTKSTNSNTAISLSGAAEVFVTVRAEDLTVTTAAVKSDQTTATSTILAVVPAIQQNHPSAAKVWVFYHYATGTPTIDVSYNVSSLTDNGVGDATINFTTAFTSANYVFNGISCVATGTAAGFMFGPILSSPTSSAFRVLASTFAGSSSDSAFNYATFYGTQ